MINLFCVKQIAELVQGVTEISALVWGGGRFYHHAKSPCFLKRTQLQTLRNVLCHVLACQRPITFKGSVAPST